MISDWQNVKKTLAFDSGQTENERDSQTPFSRDLDPEHIALINALGFNDL